MGSNGRFSDTVLNMFSRCAGVILGRGSGRLRERQDGRFSLDLGVGYPAVLVEEFDKTEVERAGTVLVNEALREYDLCMAGEFS